MTDTHGRDDSSASLDDLIVHGLDREAAEAATQNETDRRKRPLRLRGALMIAALVAGGLTSLGVITAPPAQACTFGSCGSSKVHVRFDNGFDCNGPCDTPPPSPQVNYGELITIRAHVFDDSSSCAFSGLGCTNPTGSVAFFDEGNPIGTSPLHDFCNPVGPSACAQEPDGGEGMITIRSLSGGDHRITANYLPGGGDNFDASAGFNDVTIDPLGTRTSLSQSSGSTVVGQAVTFTAQVLAIRPPELTNGVLPPGGSVDFVVNGASMASDIPDAQGWATWTTTLDGGTNDVFAQYNTDFSYAGSHSSVQTHTVSRGETTGGLTQSSNQTVFGQPFTLTDTVAATSPAVGTPTGHATFNDGTSAIGSPVALSGGVAALPVATLAVGSHSLSASYAGDTSLNPSTSNTLSHAVDKASTTSAVSIAPASATTLGNAVTLHVDVTVNSPGAGSPTGTVQFKDGTTNLGGRLALSPTGATLVTSALGGGAHPITAVYSGESNFNTSTSVVNTHTVLCTTTVSGPVSGTYNVPSAGTTCITNANITGGVNIPAGAKVSIVNSTIGSYLTANSGAGTIIVCGTTVPGITINNAAGAVTLGDPWSAGCAGNTLSGGIGLTSNHGGLRVNGNRIGNGLQVSSNNGGPAVIGGNAVTGWLQCSGNAPAPINDGRPNTAGGRTGQCATPPTF